MEIKTGPELGTVDKSPTPEEDSSTQIEKKDEPISDAKAKRLANLKPFVKGDPRFERLRGKPRVSSLHKETKLLKELAREYSKEAIEHIAWLMKTSKSHDVQLRAAQELLDRGFGKPKAVDYSEEKDSDSSGEELSDVVIDMILTKSGSYVPKDPTGENEG